MIAPQVLSRILHKMLYYLLITMILTEISNTHKDSENYKYDFILFIKLEFCQHLHYD